MLEDLKREWRHGSMVIRLIMVNVAVWLLLHLVDLPFWMMNRQGPDVLDWLLSTSNLGSLLRRPWTVFTYMFTHWEFGHIFFNMLMLWFMGRLFEDLLGGRRMLGNYLLGGLSGFALYAIGFNTLPVFSALAPVSTILGASAAVMAVLVGIAAYRPEMEVSLILIGPVRLKWIALVLVAIDLVSVRTSGNSGGHLAHIGGALYGYLASMQLRKGNDWSLSFVNGLSRITSALTPKRGPRMRVEKPYTRSARQSDTAYNKSRNDQQARIDAILDKISRSGYDSLSKDEKDFLFKAGK
ncbi:MAG: rhomboid family intramembrane serine protease [Flavobacteriales bacterium]|nr:rhomboid family intramembrane serine protease [Flavobacteriales bacterium]